MDREEIRYAAVMLIGVFIGSVSQVMLKKAAMRQYSSLLNEYCNPLVLLAYMLFVGTTLLSIWAYQVVPLSMGPVLEATSYLYVTGFGSILFKEKLNPRKVLALVCIIVGILICSMCG